MLNLGKIISESSDDPFLVFAFFTQWSVTVWSQNYSSSLISLLMDLNSPHATSRGLIWSSIGKVWTHLGLLPKLWNANHILHVAVLL